MVALITLGPNNLMVMASGTAFSWRKAVPHMAGIALGFATMTGSVALGLSAILEQFPQILSVLRVVGAAWAALAGMAIGKPALCTGGGSVEKCFAPDASLRSRDVSMGQSQGMDDGRFS